MYVWCRLKNRLRRESERYVFPSIHCRQILARLSRLSTSLSPSAPTCLGKGICRVQVGPKTHSNASSHFAFFDAFFFPWLGNQNGFWVPAAFLEVPKHIWWVLTAGPEAPQCVLWVAAACFVVPAACFGALAADMEDTHQHVLVGPRESLRRVSEIDVFP